MQSPNESIAIALECARGHVHMLEELQAPMSDTEAWSRIILQSLEFHREQRTYWRNLVHSLPAHLKEQVLAEDLGGQFEVAAEINERKPVTAHRAVRLPPPTATALATLKPTGTPVAVELRNSRAGATASGSPEAAISPCSTLATCSDGAFATPEPRTSTRIGVGLSTPGPGTASKDPLRSARASPAQLPQGGLNELQAALAKRRGGQT